MKKISLLVFPIALFGAAFFLGGCGYQTTNQGTAPASGNSTPQASSSSTTPAANSSDTTNQTAGAVTIQNFAFSPASLTIKKGESVTWTNKDSVSHQIASDQGSAVLFSGPAIPQGQSYSFTFDTAGEFSYHCAIHPSMLGKIIVQ